MEGSSEEVIREERKVCSFFLTGMILLLSILLVGLLSTPMVEAGGSGDYPPPVSGDWVISNPTLVSDETVVLKGDLIVRSGGSLGLDNVDIVMNSSFEGQYHIEVLDGGSLDANGSYFTALNKSNPYYFIVRDGGQLVLTSNTLEAMGMEDALLYEQLGLAVFSNNTTIIGNTIRENRAGIYIESASPTVNDNLIIDNFYGIWIYRSDMMVLRRDNITLNNVGIFTDGSNLVLDSCDLPENNFKGITSVSSSIYMSETSIEYTREIALSGLDSQITMINGSLDGGTYSLVLDQNSSMESYNGTIDRYDIVFKDSLSKLKVFWYINVEVVWWSDQGPVANATVDVLDPFNSSIANGTTAVDGMLMDLLVPGFDADRSKFIFHSPINVIANASGRMGNSTSELTGPMTISVMIDDIAPGINITNPPPGGYYNQSMVDIRGVMWDNETGAGYIELSVDGANYTLVNGTTIWNLTVNLSEGYHQINIRAWDIAGNSRTVNLDLTIDTIEPEVAIGSPIDGLVTTQTRIWVNGTAEPGTNLTMAGQDLGNTNGTWGLFVDLEEGVNRLTIMAVDKARNVNESTILVTRDTMVDPLILDPGNGTSTNQANLTINGTTEPGTVIIVRWSRVEGIGNNTTVASHNKTLVADPNGNFTLILPLEEGENNFTLVATDVMNNTARLNLTFYLDSTPPMLVLTSPQSRLFYTNKNGVNIKGYTEEDAEVYLGQQELQLYDLQFSIRVEVFLGMNNFTLWSVDLAGNMVKFNITVIVDKEPPPLNISRPFKPVVKHIGSYYSISGFTESNATVSVNGVKYSVREDGYFTIKRSLAFGKNKLTITARDEAGNPTSVDRVVIREKPPTDMMSVYIGISIPIIVLVVIIVSMLFYLNKQGKLKKVKRFFKRRKKGEEDLDDLDEDDLPPPIDEDLEGLSAQEIPPPEVEPMKDEEVELELGEGAEKEELEEMELLEEGTEEE